MPGSIFILREDGTLIEMQERPYDFEALLQRLLADFSNLLAGDQINPEKPRRWLLVSREMRVSGDEGADRGYLDHLFLDQDAVPTPARRSAAREPSDPARTGREDRVSECPDSHGLQASTIPHRMRRSPYRASSFLQTTEELRTPQAALSRRP